MLKLVRKNLVFLIPYSIFLVLSIILLLLIPKGELHLWMNRYHSAFLDFFFKWLTWLGDGSVIVLLGLGFALFRYRDAVLILSSYLFSGIWAQLFKRFIFPDVLRPVRFFEDESLLTTVEGVILHGSKSFPSGHSTSAFALFFLFAILTQNQRLKVVFLILAWIVGFSRVYLSQHFYIDVLAGSFIGIVSSLLICHWLKDRLTGYKNGILMSGLLNKKHELG